MKRFYFDANATTPPLSSVVEAVSRATYDFWSNPSSTYREGQHAKYLLEEARCLVANSLNVLPNQIIFCSSATEALYLLFRGLSHALKNKCALVFAGEHSACLNQLCDWTDLHWMPDKPTGDIATVVQMAANNETGIIYDMPAISGAVKIKDAVQAWGKIPVDLTDCDAAVFSGHKIGGPKGVAILWLRPELPWTTVIGGYQEHHKRGGTENLPAILGLAEAVKAIPDRIILNNKLATLRDIFEAEIMSWSDQYTIIGKNLARLPNTSSLLLRGHSGDNMQIALDLAGFAVSTGSACYGGANKPSHAIMAAGFSEHEAKSVIRISMLPDTSLNDVKELIAALRKILKH